MVWHASNNSPYPFWIRAEQPKNEKKPVKGWCFHSGALGLNRPSRSTALTILGASRLRRIVSQLSPAWAPSRLNISKSLLSPAPDAPSRRMRRMRQSHFSQLWPRNSGNLIVICCQISSYFIYMYFTVSYETFPYISCDANPKLTVNSRTFPCKRHNVRRFPNFCDEKLQVPWFMMRPEMVWKWVMVMWPYPPL